MLTKDFFDRDAFAVACDIIGKLICRIYGGEILKVRVIESECYYITDKASHASLGYTYKRRALFMESGTIYMYHARGKPSLNFSAKGEGNAVLIKSAYPVDGTDTMLGLNPNSDGTQRKPEKLCSGQTLTAMSLGLKVDEFDAKEQCKDTLWLEDDGYRPEKLIRTTRLGIPDGRDGHLMYRLIDERYRKYCTKDPKKDYDIISYEDVFQKDIQNIQP